ncbi:hypothetical protein BC567DRAFT_237998, partial [Phyllosticta citribraziliensis]
MSMGVRAGRASVDADSRNISIEVHMEVADNPMDLENDNEVVGALPPASKIEPLDVIKVEVLTAANRFSIYSPKRRQSFDSSRRRCVASSMATVGVPVPVPVPSHEISTADTCSRSSWRGAATHSRPAQSLRPLFTALPEGHQILNLGAGEAECSNLICLRQSGARSLSRSRIPHVY